MASTHSPRLALLGSILVLGAAVGLTVGGAARLQPGVTPAPAPTPAPQAAKVGLIDVSKVVNSLKELEDRNGAIKAKALEYKDELTKLNNKMDALKNSLETNIIPQTDYKRRADAASELFEVKTTLEVKTKIYQQRFDIERGDLLHELYDKMTIAAAKLAKAEGYDLLIVDDRIIELPPLNTTTIDNINHIVETKRLVYARDGLDVTKRLITIMDNDYAAGVKTTPTAAPAPLNPSANPSAPTNPGAPGAPAKPTPTNPKPSTPAPTTPR